VLGRGTVLGERYTLTERLGGGAMGEVWRADDRVFERQVAVKILRPGLLDDATFAARFRREARLLATLSHPGIVNVHDYGESGGEDDGGDDPGVRVAYIVMELIDGTPLDEVLAEGGPLPVEKALDIVAQALEGLHAAHQREIVHRDIKPANLMLRADGRVTVTDFGIARTPSGTKLTDTHSVIGTALYMSPEHAEGLGAVPASDLYSMGVLCYQLLTGELPFTGETAVQVLLKQIREPAPELPDTFAEPVRAFVARALAKEPEARYADAAAMAEAARRAAAGQPAEPVPAPVPVPASPPSAPPPGKEAKAKAEDTIVLGSKRKQGQKESQKQKRRRIPAVLLLPLVITLGGGTIWYMDPLPDQGETNAPEAGATGSGGQGPDASDPGSSSPDASDDPESERDPSQSPSGSPSEDEEEDAGSENANQGGSDGTSGGGSGDGTSGGGGSSGGGGTSGGGDGPSGGDGTSGGGGTSSGSGGGGTDDPPPSDNDPTPDTPENCGGDNWGHITNVGNGLRIGLSTGTPEDGAKVVMGGSNDAFGWVFSNFYGAPSFYACNFDSPQLSYNNNEGGVVLSSGVTYWEIDDSAPSGASYLKVAYSGNTQCLTSNGEGKQLTLITCTPGNGSQMWRIPDSWG
jgi:eukaryotic-like serine/threonine-protein kinase